MVASTPATAPLENGEEDIPRASEDDDDRTIGHPLGVLPSGNALTCASQHENARRFMGLFGRMPGELLLNLLEHFDSETLVKLGSTCRGLYGYCQHDQLWRELAVEDGAPEYEWRGSWRSSLLGLRSAKGAKVDCSSLFCDALYRPFLCSQINLNDYATNIPPRNEISRLRDISPSEFSSSWVDKPFILLEPVKTWSVFQEWDEDYLLDRYGEVSFICEAVQWPLKKYINYTHTTQDESPIYLFDRAFVEKMNLSVGGRDTSSDNAYEPPSAFQDDLFAVLREQRPDHRWLIQGPKGSGSTFHKDPNATSAWNAVIRGRKYWIMFPSSVLPPGVHVSEDQSEVTSPLSIAEWLLTFHAEARNTPGCIEGICFEGEVLHVPSGW
jgi:hypothetical protein